MTSSETRQIWSVSGLNREARALLENGLGVVWIEAEISNLARPASGHLYFTLKDQNAQVRAAFFRQRQRGMAADLNNGDQVLVRAKLSLYEPRGDYQLIVEHAEPAGQGALQRQFEILKAKLAAEGLFNDSNKQALPALPRQIGLVTSASGAALRDILQVLNRRMPSTPVIVYASSVQGSAAPEELRRALHKAVYRDEVDVLIMTRGGGSIEDLAAFNDEQLARDIAKCPIPLISGVGHEVDYTIVDFVADVRAPTPSAAAEIAVPDRFELLSQLKTQRQQFNRLLRRVIENRQQRQDQLSRRLSLQSPAIKVAQQINQLAALGRALQRTGQARLERAVSRLAIAKNRLLVQKPKRTVVQRQNQLALLTQRMTTIMRQRIMRAQHDVGGLARALNAVSPLATLERGYTITTRDSDGKAITSSSDVAINDRINLRLHSGQLVATVLEVTADPKKVDLNS